MTTWWAGRIRQTWRHVTGRVPARERDGLCDWVTAAQLAVFDGMPRPDRRHGLDVVDSLRAAGHQDRELLLAGLLHDCGKGQTVGLWHRIAWSLGERYGERTLFMAGRLPGFAAAFERIATHAERSAEMALGAGCSARTADLIRGQSEPTDAIHGEALRLADEAR